MWLLGSARAIPRNYYHVVLNDAQLDVFGAVANYSRVVTSAGSFGTLLTDVDFTLSDRMSSYWSNFAVSGDPNGKGLPAWTPYDPTNEPYLELGDTIQTKRHLLKPQLDFLEQAGERLRRPTSQPQN